MTVAAVIPCLNEAESIGRLVGILRSRVDRVIVVDNGSIDGTGAAALAAGAEVVREDRRGYGFACKAGVDAAKSADIVVLLDGDASDDPSDLPRIVGPIERGEADLVVGSRTLGVREPGSMTAQQLFGNWLVGWLMGRIYGTRVTDLGPFRAIRPAKLLSLDMREMTFGWSVEMAVKAARAQYRYREVAVTYRRRAAGRSKVGATLAGSLQVGWCIVSTTFRYSRWRPR